MLTASLESPSFAAVTLVTTPSAPNASSPASSTGTLTLYLPHEVAATISGLDADTLTLLLLELVRTTTCAPPRGVHG